MSSRALISPQADFWLLGGFSIAMLSVVGLLTSGWLGQDWTPQIIQPLFMTFIALQFVVNYPHFAYSYQLFYKDFLVYLRSPEAETGSKVRLLVAGIIVPAALVAYMTLTGLLQSKQLMGYSLTLYIFLSAWHYSKQGYGALITMSVYKRIFYGNWQKRILYVNAYLAPLYAFSSIDFTRKSPYAPDSGVALFIPPVPPILHSALQAAFCLSTLLALGVFIRVWLVEKKGFSVNGFVGYVSGCYVWLIIPVYSFFLATFIPFFHSLQYLPFVYKFKKSELQSREKSFTPEQKGRKLAAVLMGIFILAGIALGALFFDGIPKAFDSLMAPWTGAVSGTFFAIAFTVIINIHHFFIDHAFWRRDNKAMQNYLFNA